MQTHRDPALTASFTIRLEGRDPDHCQFTPDEAKAMYSAGLRFSCFDEAFGEFRLSIPYRMLHNLDKDTLTIEQN